MKIQSADHLMLAPGEEDKFTPFAVVTSDWHLQENIWKTRPEIVGDSTASIANMCASVFWDPGDSLVRVPSHPYGLGLIVAGDIMDSDRPSAYVVSRLRDFLEHGSREEFIWSRWCLGQHDARQNWIGSLIPVKFDNFGLSRYSAAICRNLSARSWRHPDRMPRPAPDNIDSVFSTEFYKFMHLFSECSVSRDWTANLDYSSAWARFVPDGVGYAFNVHVVHQPWAETCGFHSRFSLEEYLRNNPDCLLMISGDVHRSEALSITFPDRPGYEVLFLSPGSLAMQSIDESPDKYVWMLHFRNTPGGLNPFEHSLNKDLRSWLRISRQLVATRPVSDFHIYSQEDLDVLLGNTMADRLIGKKKVHYPCELDVPLHRYYLHKNLDVSALTRESKSEHHYHYHPFFIDMYSRKTEIRTTGLTTPVACDIPEAVQSLRMEQQAKDLLLGLVTDPGTASRSLSDWAGRVMQEGE